MSFAPLAGRLAARAAELRPAEGSRDTLAKFAALVMCALLDMLILVCEMLDERAALGARPVMAPTLRVSNAASIPAPRAARHAPLGLAPKRRAVTPKVADVSSEIAEATASRPWLAWPRDRCGSRPGLPATVTPPRKSAFPPAPRHVHFVTLS